MAPPVPTGLPAGAPVRNSIDAFVQARLAKQGITPAPEAPRATLIRRLSLDLTGLAPSPADVAAFVADKDPAAYEKLVDRLLASPAFGERMAWDWLDAARYADSNGYQGDGERTMWPWRDWVAQAFNKNLPYDQFTVWQLAGDLLPDATDEQRLATGFCRNHPINGEGGRISEENRVDYVIDMAETTATVWLGLTMNCCRCHDHKYDPLTRRDYYGLFAYFNQTPVDGGGGNPQTPPVLAVIPDSQREQIKQLDEQLARLGGELDRRAAELAGKQAAWEAEQLASGGSTPWQALKPTSATALHQTLAIRDDDSILAGGPNPPQDTYTVTATTDADRVSAVRLEALRDPSLTQNGLARSDSGNFVLTELEISAQRPGESEPKRLKIGSGLASFEQPGFKITGAFDGSPATGWAVHEGRFLDREHEGVFRLAEPFEAGPGTILTFTLRHDSPHISHNLGRFRLSVTAAADPQLAGAKQPLLAALAVAADKRSPDQKQVVAEAYLQTDEAYRKLVKQRDELRQQQDNLRNGSIKVMVMQDQPQPRKTFLLERGLYNQPGPEVTADVPAVLPRMAADLPANRLGLARWLVSAEQPLTPRVTVNRFWQQLFGIGLVKTTEDFGVQGEMPLQLDLLDYLAAEFRSSGWNVKALVRLIVTSHTYRQSSKLTPALAEHDPANRLLARGPRFRMPSWMLRDQALAASGLLVPQLGGAAGQRLSAGRRLGRSHLRRQGLSPGSRRRALSPQRLHVLAADRRPDDVLRQRRPASLHGQSAPDEYAAPCAADAQRHHVCRSGPVLAERVLDGRLPDAPAAQAADAARLDAVLLRVLGPARHATASGRSCWRRWPVRGPSSRPRPSWPASCWPWANRNATSKSIRSSMPPGPRWPWPC